MSLTTVFHVSIYALVCLSALMLAIAEESPFPAGLSIPFAILAWYFNERQRRMRLPTMWASMLGLVAFAAAALELVGAEFADDPGMITEARVLGGSHLLTYLTWIALFQDKYSRQYWWLLGLSCMHIAVGSILTQHPMFGALLLVFLFLSLWTLSTYSLYLTRYNFEQAEGSDRESRTTPGHAAGGVAVSFVSIGALDSSHTRSSVEHVPTHHQRDEYRGSIQLDPDEHWINSRFTIGTIATTMMALLVGAMFYLLIPRVWVGKSHEFESSYSSPVRTVTGFTDEVQLGEIGQILESNVPVFEVRITNAATGEAQDVMQLARRMGYTEPMFRGSAMGRYETGRWHVLRESHQVTRLLPPARMSERRSRQHYVFRTPPASRTLFAMHPVFATEFSAGLMHPHIDIATSMVVSEEQNGSDLPEYVLISGVPRQTRFGPSFAAPTSTTSLYTQRSVLGTLTQLPPGLDRLKALASEIDATVDREGKSGTPIDLQVARAIEHHLRDSGKYHYSLSADIVDPTIDPVEDFLFNRRTGHCEYYASAMALMLRAVGIPSRLVSGFKGGETSTIARSFVVEERHAHAWVEAYVPTSQQRAMDRRWVTFDPTPAAERNISVRAIGADRSTSQNLQSLLTGIWQQRILRLSVDEQRQRIYTPLGTWLKDQVSSVARPLGPRSKAVVEFLSNPREWFSIATFAVTAIVLVAVIVTRALWCRFMPGHHSVVAWFRSAIHELLERWRDRHQVQRVDFYHQFIRVLAAHGLTCHRSRTALEFATQIDDRLGAFLDEHGLADLPAKLVHSYYQVRFGSRTLSPSETEQLATSILALKKTLKTHSAQVRELRNGSHPPAAPDIVSE